MDKGCSLEQAQEMVARFSLPTAIEQVPLVQALGRITADDQLASQPYPPYDQALYDGYACSPSWLEKRGETLVFSVAGEIAAGDSEEKEAIDGAAYRIMTGAPVPAGSHRVIPQEHCRVIGGRLSVPWDVFHHIQKNIRLMGEDIVSGSVVVKKGERISPVMVAALADSGCCEVRLRKRPVVSYFCSGSELVDGGEKLSHGAKISSNRYLLDGLIQSFGGVVRDYATIGDDGAALSNHIKRVAAEGADIIISTGGIGPGKYDLLASAFAESGGEILFTRMHMRPGKSTLLGRIGKSLFFGLPGPPPAVLAIFHILVRRALVLMQGGPLSSIDMQEAVLGDEITQNGSSENVLLKPGRVYLHGGQVRAYPTAEGEYPNCFILVPAGKKTLLPGESVQVLSMQFADQAVV